MGVLHMSRSSRNRKGRCSMRGRAGSLFATILCAALIIAGSSKASGDGFMDIAVRDTPQHEIRFTSGKTIYIEGLVGDQWVSRYWVADGRIPYPYWLFADPAFDIQIKQDPAVESPTPLSSGWQWVSATELPRTDRGSRHFAVELKNAIYPLNVRVHTLLDETPVMVRWLEITNNSDCPVALTAVSPWSGRLWSGQRLPTALAFTLGINPNPEWSGGLEWRPLPLGKTVVEGNFGATGYDDPFFIVRNDSMGEYFICHLAWSANYRMEFECQPDPYRPQSGLSFGIGPSAKDALRVIAPGETITTPAVHLGYVASDLDAAVQAMHDHIRRSVVPRRDPERAYLIQVDTPGDQGYFTGDAFNEENVMKCIDVAAAIGAELFVMDCPWYDYYGDWVPSPIRFPRGLAPVVEYAHQKGLLFGLQTEVEGGRGNWNQSKVFRSIPIGLGRTM